MHLGQAAGFDAEALRTLLADSAAGSEFLRHDVQRVFSARRPDSAGQDGALALVTVRHRVPRRSSSPRE
jgi:hypothetical protein